MELYKTKPTTSLKELPFEYWSSWPTLIDCVDYTEDQTLSRTHNLVARYVFCIDNAIDIESYDSAEDEQFAVCGYQKRIYAKMGNKRYDSPRCKVCSSLDEVQEFIKTLTSDNEIFVFSLKNDLFAKANQMKKEREKAFQEYLSRKVYFKGDIVITDPCYILNRDERYDKNNLPRHRFFSYEAVSDYPDYDGLYSLIYEMENARYEHLLKIYQMHYYERTEFVDDAVFRGFRHGTLERDTIYGDWSCTVFDVNTEESIGQFGADGGMVCVYSMEDVERYSHEKAEWLRNSPHAATIIKDFDGYVCFEVEDRNVHVCGYGNKNFRSSQTGF